jgi:4-hydroxyphenylpyruvate dioxygenase
MVDADEEGYLLQILQNQYRIDQLVFFEIIQRMGAKVLSREFKALFESIEREQELRGTL